MKSSLDSKISCDQPYIIDLSDLVEPSQESIESINTTIEIYDYEEMSENEIDTMFKQEKTLSEQGNLLKGIANKTIRRQGFRRLHTLFIYVLFSVKHNL